MYSVGIYTLGCKVSQYESEAIAESFLSLGFTLRDFSEVCDAYVINTCTVTAESDRKSRQIIRRARKTNPDAVIAVLGCYSQRSPQEIERLDVNIVQGTDNKLSVVWRVKEMLDLEKRDRIVDVSGLDGVCFERMSVRGTPRTRAYVKIEDGCNSKCSYCAIREARGRVRSKPRLDVISEVRALAASGVKEIVLTGIETGHYGLDFDGEYTLGDLIRELDGCAHARIRLGSLAPELIGKDFVDKVRGVKNLCPHFHISMQSGSDRVLALMKRRYNTEMAYRNIELLKSAFPSATFTADLMVGFPGESDEDFLKTVEFVKRVGLLDAHVFAFSPREGTDAFSMREQVLPDVKSRRSRELIKEKNRTRDDTLSALIREAKPLRFILESYVDGEYTAHADNFAEARITLPEGLGGKEVTAIPVSHKSGVLTAVVEQLTDDKM